MTSTPFDGMPMERVTCGCGQTYKSRCCIDLRTKSQGACPRCGDDHPQKREAMRAQQGATP